MIIGVTCPNCGNKYDVTDRLAGRRVRCKGCHTNFRVPVPTQVEKVKKVESVGRLDEFFEEEGEPEALAATPRSRKNQEITDLGGSSRFLMALVFFEMIFGYLATRSTGSARFWAFLFIGLIGGFLLISSAARWESYKQSWRARIVAFLFGDDGARFLHELIGIVLVLISALILVGLVPWPFAAPLVEENPPAAVSPDP